MSLRPEQIDALLHPIAGARVQKRDGLSHLEAYDVRRRLVNIFGFGGWSGEVLDMTMLYEEAGEKSKDDRTWRTYSVGYRCTYRLTIHATGAVYTESASGDATNFPETKRADAHDFAIKTAESQAMKRCATNLGDQFGLSLYNRGSLAPLVVYVLGEDPAKWTPDGVVRPRHEQQADTADHVTEQLAPEDPAPAGEPAPPEQAQPSVLPATTMEDDYAEQVRAIATDPKRNTNAKRAALSKLLMRAQRDGVTKRHVATETGEAVTLEALVQAAVAAVGRD